MASNKVILLIGIGIGIIGAIVVIYILKDRQFKISEIKHESVDNSHNLIKNLANDNTAYNNDENWVIERNNDGSIKAINVKRDVKVNR